MNQKTSTSKIEMNKDIQPGPVAQTDSNTWLNRNVVGMGVTSFLSDASHEMATTVLPGFLAVIGAPPSAL
ncbi:MFS transporter, partial [Sphingobacteriales bacterium CHB3]|nr:MFS transporter [Sphingobacteriales bacterium CHB3]